MRYGKKLLLQEDCAGAEIKKLHDLEPAFQAGKLSNYLQKSQYDENGARLGFLSHKEV